MACLDAASGDGSLLGALPLQQKNTDNKQSLLSEVVLHQGASSAGFLTYFAPVAGLVRGTGAGGCIHPARAVPPPHASPDGVETCPLLVKPGRNLWEDEAEPSFAGTNPALNPLRRAGLAVTAELQATITACTPFSSPPQISQGSGQPPPAEMQGMEMQILGSLGGSRSNAALTC